MGGGDKSSGSDSKIVKKENNIKSLEEIGLTLSRTHSMNPFQMMEHLKMKFILPLQEMVFLIKRS